MNSIRQYPHYNRGEQFIKSLIERFCIKNGQVLSNTFKIKK